jgi:hypothetical protein
MPIEELHPPGEDEPDVKTWLPLVANFLFLVFPAPPVSFFSDTILLKSAAKSAIVSEKVKQKQVKSGERKLQNKR